MTENSPKLINHPESLEVYPIAFNTAMTIFEVSQKFPQEEKIGFNRSNSVKCQYLGWERGRQLYSQYHQILGMIVKISNNAAQWLLKKDENFD